MIEFRPLLWLSVAACTMAALPACVSQTSAPTTAAPISQLRASGNEPFWSVKVDGNVLTYTTPEMQPGTRMIAERHVGPDGIGFSGNDGDTPFELSLRHGQCQDTMSGEMFEYTSSFTYGDRELTGCAGEISE